MKVDNAHNIYRSGVQALSVRTQVQNVENPHSANPSTLGVQYPLLVVEGQGAHPRASGFRKQVWVYSADAGVCHAWKAAGKSQQRHLYM